MSFHDESPVYVQLAAILKSGIVDGRYPADSALPSVRELALLYKINPNTVQKAYTILEDSNVVIVKKGLGRFVTTNTQSLKLLKAEQKKKLSTDILSLLSHSGLSEQEQLELLEITMTQLTAHQK